MKMELNATAVLAVAGLGLGAYVAWKGGKLASAAASAVGEGAKAAAQAVNPLNSENIFAAAVNSAGGTIAGDTNWTLGGWIYDVTHSDPAAPSTTKSTIYSPQFDAMGNYLGDYASANTGGATGSW